MGMWIMCYIFVQILCSNFTKLHYIILQCNLRSREETYQHCMTNLRFDICAHMLLHGFRMQDKLHVAL